MLELKDISKTYKTSKGVKTEALKHVNLKFPKKGMVFVLGKSGSGKSTLLNMVGGLDQASAGEIIINGKSSKDFSQADYDSYRNTDVGFIFQEFNLMDAYTIHKNIEMALQLQQKEDNEHIIDELLDKLGLKDYGNRFPNELSGGQKQRVAIARALVKQPEILMADEPTGALDSSTGKEIFDTLKELSKEKLVIVVSHDRDAADTYADRIIEFKDGEVSSDTAEHQDVEVSDEAFKSIKSHLPFKDSLRLGISCLAHKKIRMVFTIILTTFALIFLGLANSIGYFNDTNAHYKAMSDYEETTIGIKRQILNDDGDVIRMWDGFFLPLQDSEIAKIINDTKQTFANVYVSSNDETISSSSMGLLVDETSVYDETVGAYFLTEMDNFDTLGYKDVLGKYPTSNDEVAISSFLADLIIKFGVSGSDGKAIIPTDFQDILDKKVTINAYGKNLTISGIVKFDFSDYDSLKTENSRAMSQDKWTMQSQFSKISNIKADKLFVKKGYVEALQLPKSNVLRSQNTAVMLASASDDSGYIGELGYLNKEVTYFDGSEMKTVSSLAKNEVLLTPDILNNFGYGEHHQALTGKSYEEKLEHFKQFASRYIGKKRMLQYSEFYASTNYKLNQEVTILGFILPDEEMFSDVNMLYDSNPDGFNGAYANKELVDPLISSPLFIGELITSTSGDPLKAMIEQYPGTNELAAHTFVSGDIADIHEITIVISKVFLVASIVFFTFAAMLMMNFIIVSISYRKKDIGILRAIGARSTDVLKIFVWEGITLAIISFILTMIGLYAIASLVNKFSFDEIGYFIAPIILTLRQPITLILTLIVVTTIACFLPIMKISRQKPIDAIKK